jgi:hypothetical protein
MPPNPRVAASGSTVPASEIVRGDVPDDDGSKCGGPSPREPRRRHEDRRDGRAHQRRRAEPREEEPVTRRQAKAGRDEGDGQRALERLGHEGAGSAQGARNHGELGAVSDTSFGQEQRDERREPEQHEPERGG